MWKLASPIKTASPFLPWWSGNVLDPLGVPSSPEEPEPTQGSRTQKVGPQAQGELPPHPLPGPVPGGSEDPGQTWCSPSHLLTTSPFSSPASRGRPEGGGKSSRTACLCQQLHPPGLLLPTGTQWGKDGRESGAKVGKAHFVGMNMWVTFCGSIISIYVKLYI